MKHKSNLIEASFHALCQWMLKISSREWQLSLSSKKIFVNIQKVTLRFIQLSNSLELNSIIGKYTSSSAMELLYIISSHTSELPDKLRLNAKCLSSFLYSNSHPSPHDNDEEENTLSYFDELSHHYMIEGETILSILEDHSLLHNNSNSNNNLLSQSNNHDSSITSELLVCIRNRCGKYIYRMQPLFIIDNLQNTKTNDIAAELIKESDVNNNNFSMTTEQQHNIENCMQKTNKNNSEMLGANPFRSALNNLQTSGNIMFWNSTYDGNYPHPEMKLSTVESNLNNSYGLVSAWMNPFIDALKRQELAEINSLKVDNYCKHTVLCHEPMFDSINNQNTKSRQLLSHLGYLGLDKFGKILELKADNILYENLRVLDVCPDKEQLSAWIVYARNVTKGNKHIIETVKHDCANDSNNISHCKAYSTQYINFLRGLGELVNLDSHLGI
jgi:hypothetical protein